MLLVAALLARKITKEFPLKSGHVAFEESANIPFNANIPFKWGIIRKSESVNRIASLTLGPSYPTSNSIGVRVVSLVAYIKVHDIDVEIARIGGKK